MMEHKAIKKVSIGDIGKNQPKITIADTVDFRTRYHFDPPLTPRQLVDCWLDPSDRDMANVKKWVIIGANNRAQIAIPLMKLLKTLLPKDALAKGLIQFKQVPKLGWANVKQRVLKRYNVSDIIFRSNADSVSSITIESNIPLYQKEPEECHRRHIHAILRTVIICYPEVLFELEPHGCYRGGQCDIKLEQLMKKLALQTHGKEETK